MKNHSYSRSDLTDIEAQIWQLGDKLDRLESEYQEKCAGGCVDIDARAAIREGRAALEALELKRADMQLRCGAEEDDVFGDNYADDDAAGWR